MGFSRYYGGRASPELFPGEYDQNEHEYDSGYEAVAEGVQAGEEAGFSFLHRFQLGVAVLALDGPFEDLLFAEGAFGLRFCRQRHGDKTQSDEGGRKLKHPPGV